MSSSEPVRSPVSAPTDPPCKRAAPSGAPRLGVNLLFLVPGQVGGSETYVRATLRAMAEVAPETILYLFTNRENHDSFFAELSRFRNVVFVPLGTRASSRLRRAWAEFVRLPLRARRLRLDALWHPGNVAPPFAPCPSVATVHDMQYRRFPEDYSRCELLLMRAVTGLALARADRVIAVSEFAKSEIVRFSRVPPERVAVVPHGVSDAFAAPAAPSRPLPLPPGDGPLLLSLSNTYPHKSLEDAVAVFGALAPDFPTLRFALVGRPRRGEDAVRRAFDALPPEVRARAARVEWIPPEDLAALYAATSVFLFPSRYEGFGLPVLEALRAGVPVVAARAASVPEVGGEAARYFEPGAVAEAAALVRDLLLAPPSAEERAAFRARAASFTWARTAEGTLRALLPERRKPRVLLATPCRNAAATLPALLDAVDAQVTPGAPFELRHVVRDAASTDGTAALLAARARPWRTVVSEPDGGPPDALNRAFAAAGDADYVAWLNADDAWAPGALARLVRTLEENPRASFAFGRCPVVDAAGREIRRPVTRFKEAFHPFASRAVLLTLNFVCQPATLIRASALRAAGPLRTDLLAAWDYDLWLRLLRSGPCVRVRGGDPVAFFRWTPGSISGANFRRQFDEELALAVADAGRFSLPALLHRGVRLGIVSIYSLLARRR